MPGLWDCDLSQRHLLNWLSHPHALKDFILKIYLFIWERACVSRGNSRGREFQADSPRTSELVLGLHMGCDHRTHEITTWAETNSQLLNQLSRPFPKMFVRCLTEGYWKNSLVACSREQQRRLWTVLLPDELAWGRGGRWSLIWSISFQGEKNLGTKQKRREFQHRNLGLWPI